MVWQFLIAVLVVVACSVYALWSLMPAGLKRRVAAWRGKPLPDQGPCGGCDNCGSAAVATSTKASAATGESVIHIVRRPPVS